MQEGLKHLQVKSSLVFIPIIYCFVANLSNEFRRNLVKHYIYILTLVILYFLITAVVKYWHTNDTSVFFYHSLVSPFEQHAIQFSILVFIAIACLLQKAGRGIYIKSKVIHLCLVIYFIFFLVLLSSKLVISYTFVYLLYYLISHSRKSGFTRITTFAFFFIGIIIIALTLFTKNPVSKRFYEIINGDIGMVKNEKYNQNTYFNGLQFRLLQWRFTSEILNENKAWLTGISPGDSQKALDEKYRSRDMYIGNGTDSHGFLGYNTHNQMLESVLQTGIFGVMAFLLLCYGMLKMAWKAKSSSFTAIILLLIANTFIESVFETQYGLIIYTFFPLFLYKLMRPVKE